MYLSRIKFENWKKFKEAEFIFKTPQQGKPLVLIGAMNGTGKTSFLFGLYLGLFGSAGLRHTEGFESYSNGDFAYYKKAIQQLRRRSKNDTPIEMTTEPDDPTTIDITFSPSGKSKPGEKEVRVIRRWFFTGNNQPRTGESFETLELFIDGTPLKFPSLDEGNARIERYLFNPDLMPAFFFDGEQAQKLISNSGGDGMKRAVNVMFGTTIVQEALEAIKNYSSNSATKTGGKRAATAIETDLKAKIEARELIEDNILEKETAIKNLEESKSLLENQRSLINEDLQKIGGGRDSNITKYGAQLEEATTEKNKLEKNLLAILSKLGLGLGLSRLSNTLQSRLKSEEAREKWEHLRDGTLSKKENILALALPEPYENDTLLSQITEDNFEKLKVRFLGALDSIFDPIPDYCAKIYILGHVKGDQRVRLIKNLSHFMEFSFNSIKTDATRVKQLKEKISDILLIKERIGNISVQLKELTDKFTNFNNQISYLSKQIGGLENELKSLKTDLGHVNKTIQDLSAKLLLIVPEQMRLNVAERLRNILTLLYDRLKPIASERLEAYISQHFIKYADERFKDGNIVFSNNGIPMFSSPQIPETPIQNMSGFERRSFGIAFSTALIEITKKRLPLVIDTPIGNADSVYRSRLLNELSSIDLDQIIILPHDKEVDEDLIEEIESKINQKFLLVYDEHTDSSNVYPDKYFGD